MPSDFCLISAAVMALAPKSHAPILLGWLAKYTDQFGREMLDTFGRVLYFWFLVLAIATANWFLDTAIPPHS